MKSLQSSLLGQRCLVSTDVGTHLEILAAKLMIHCQWIPGLLQASQRGHLAQWSIAWLPRVVEDVVCIGPAANEEDCPEDSQANQALRTAQGTEWDTRVDI